MDSKMISNVSNDSTLTESWNVVDPQELNNISESSDEESIEVIDEEAHHTQAQLYEEDTAPSGEYTDETESEKDDENECSSDENITDCSCAIIPVRPPEDQFTHFQRASHFLIVLVAVILCGTMSSLLLLKVEELAMVVVTLKKELASYKDFGVTGGSTQEEVNQDSIISNGLNYLDDELYYELLDLYSFGFDSPSPPNENAINFRYKKSLKSLEPVLLKILDGKEKENSQTLELFHNIPNHLSILSNQRDNWTITEFVVSWKEKLTANNKNLIEDIKNMQLKIIKHVDKSLRKIQMRFFKNLCNLLNFKRAECYQSFIKPHENHNEPFPDDGLEEDLYTTGKEEIKNDNAKAVPASETKANRPPCKKMSPTEQGCKIKMNERPKVYGNGNKFATDGVRTNVNDEEKIVRNVRHTVSRSNGMDEEQLSKYKQSQRSNRRRTQGGNRLNRGCYKKQDCVKLKKKHESIHINNKVKTNSMMRCQIPNKHMEQKGIETFKMKFIIRVTLGF